MKIYLVRHTAPLVDKGVCYGHSDLDVAESFRREVSFIRPHLPAGVELIYSSPSQRCRKLADTLFAPAAICTSPDLKELNFGDWEMQNWDAIPENELRPWMDDFIYTSPPNGETYMQMHERVIRRFRKIQQKTLSSSVIVTHGGVIRSILSHITGMPLQDAFKLFTIHYGCVIEVSFRHLSVNYKYLHNPLDGG